MLITNIKALCKLHGVQIRQLEADCGLGKNTFHRWRISSPSCDKVVAVANYFNVSLDELAQDELSTDKETLEFARQFQSLTAEQRNLVRVYMSLVQSR